MEAISTLVPSAAKASLVGLNTSPQYLKPQVSGSLWGKYQRIATAHSTRLASGPKIMKARPPSRLPRISQPRAGFMTDATDRRLSPAVAQLRRAQTTTPEAQPIFVTKRSLRASRALRKSRSQAARSGG